MKKFVKFLLIAIFAGTFFASCELTADIDEQPDTEFFFTEKKKSVNTNGSGHNDVDNDEE